MKYLIAVFVFMMPLMAYSAEWKLCVDDKDKKIEVELNSLKVDNKKAVGWIRTTFRSVQSAGGFRFDQAIEFSAVLCDKKMINNLEGALYLKGDPVYMTKADDKLDNYRRVYPDSSGDLKLFILCAEASLNNLKKVAK